MRLNLDEAIRKIRSYYRTYRRMPSYSRMCRMFGYSSKGAAFHLVKKLVKAGYLYKDYKGRISLAKNTLPLPILGVIKAGYPVPAEEQLIDEVSFDDYLVAHPDDSYLLRVSGDSMVDAGINEKDIVIVDKAKRPKNKDIVVAYIDNEFTLKYLQEKRGKVCLVAANKKYPIIYPKENLTIEGVVVSVIRRYS